MNRGKPEPLIKKYKFLVNEFFSKNEKKMKYF